MAKKKNKPKNVVYLMRHLSTGEIEQYDSLEDATECMEEYETYAVFEAKLLGNYEVENHKKLIKVKANTNVE